MDQQPRTFRVEQLGPPRGASGAQANETVSNLDDLVTHHPGGNRDANMLDGRIRGVEDQKPNYRGGDRSYAYIDGEFQEVIDRSTDRYGSLKQDQVLLVKDFILEDPAPAQDGSARSIGVPSPATGYVSRVVASGGMVEIMDRKGGDVIARVRHLNPISVQEDQSIVYGQSLGTQGRQGLPPTAGVHVHIEMDTGHHRQFQNYMDDLAGGRLPVQAEFRQGVQPQLVVDDGVMRLGQSNERIRDLQRVMSEEGYRAAGGGPLDRDGVYRLGMQGALLDFQRDHGVPQTGNIDPATLRMAPAQPERAVDRQDHFQPHRAMPIPRPEAPTAPGHPAHPDHRPGVVDPLPEPVNRHASHPSATDPARPLAQLSAQDRQLFDRIRSEAPAHLSDEVVASAMLASKRAGIDAADKIGLVAMAGDRLCVGGTMPGYHAVVDTTQPMPQLQEIVQQAKSLDSQRLAQNQEQGAQSVQNDRGRSI